MAQKSRQFITLEISQLFLHAPFRAVRICDFSNVIKLGSGSADILVRLHGQVKRQRTKMSAPRENRRGALWERMRPFRLANGSYPGPKSAHGKLREPSACRTGRPEQRRRIKCPVKEPYTKAGKRGNVVYQRARYGQISYPYPVPPNPRTAAQRAIRGLFGAVSARWARPPRRSAGAGATRAKPGKPGAGSASNGRCPCASRVHEEIVG